MTLLLKKISICSEEVDSEKSRWRCSVNLIAANLKKAIWSNKQIQLSSRCTNSHMSMWCSSQKNKCSLRDPIKSKHRDVHNIDHLGYSSAQIPNRRRQTNRRGRRWKKGGGFSELGPNSAQGGGVKMHGSIRQSIWEAKGWQAPAEAWVKSRGQEGGLILEHQENWSWRLAKGTCISSAHWNTDFLPVWGYGLGLGANDTL